MSTTLALIDAFAAQPFTGNQAAVAVLSEEPDDPWMQSVAAELQLSETAFCWPEGGGYRLRWFTPRVEVDLCGHATVAAAAALWADGHLHRDEPAEFLTRSGPLRCRRTTAGEIDMEVPALASEPTTVPLDWRRLGLAEPPAEVLSGSGATEEGFLMAVLGAASEVRSADIDLAFLAAAEPRPLILTARGDRHLDVVSRVFAPTLGVPEDPVTGSAHALLAPFWSERLGQGELLCHQASTRGGDLRATVAEDRVILTGRAVVMGHLMLTPAAAPPG